MASLLTVKNGSATFSKIDADGAALRDDGTAALVEAGVSKGSAAKLVDAGLGTVDAIRGADAEALAGLALSKTSVRVIEALLDDGTAAGGD